MKDKLKDIDVTLYLIFIALSVMCTSYVILEIKAIKAVKKQNEIMTEIVEKMREND